MGVFFLCFFLGGGGGCIFGGWYYFEHDCPFYNSLYKKLVQNVLIWQPKHLLQELIIKIQIHF